MPKPHPNDISIGKDKWITFIDVVGRQENAVSIDDMLTPLDSFWKALETECVAACCGIDAFALWPDDIRRVSAHSDAKLLAEALASLRRFVESTASDAFVSQKLNNYFDRRVLLQIIDHIEAHSQSPAHRCFGTKR